MEEKVKLEVTIQHIQEKSSENDCHVFLISW
jgi:hypothetical protein